MLNISIIPDTALSHWQHVLTDKAVKQATLRALNKTARWLRTQVARDTAKSLSIKVSAVKKDLLLLRPNRQHMQAGVALAKHAGVIQAVKLGTPKQMQQGVRTGKRFWSKAFIATMPSGHRGVFRRRGHARLPIQEMRLVVTGRMATVMQDLADDKAAAYFETVFTRELNYLARQQ